MHVRHTVREDSETSINSDGRHCMVSTVDLELLQGQHECPPYGKALGKTDGKKVISRTYKRSYLHDISGFSNTPSPVEVDKVN